MKKISHQNEINIYYNFSISPINIKFVYVCITNYNIHMILIYIIIKIIVHQFRIYSTKLNIMQ